MSILLATLCLNEMEWLPNLYEQHKDWPGLQKWVFVEAADKVYATTNPNMTTIDGFSMDGTTDWLRDLASQDDRIIYIPFGFTSHKKPDQGKCPARNAYLEEAEKNNPNHIFVLDADEFYTQQHQEIITHEMQKRKGIRAFYFPHIHPWHPPSIAHLPLFHYQVTGGLWDTGFIRGWTWSLGCRYKRNHNHISDPEGNLLQRISVKQYDKKGGTVPVCVHMGFCASLITRQAKHRYYEARGEGKIDNRQRYVDCRKAFENWKPGDQLPRGARVDDYSGPIPECFQ